MSFIRSRIIPFVIATVIAFICVVGAALALPALFGGQSFSVLSNSMAPAVNTGDMVTVIPLKPRDIEVGQIVAFNDP